MPKIAKIETMPCPESDCKGSMVRRHNKEGKPFWSCTEMKCNATHGAHKDGTSLGVPGDRYTRRIRKFTHDVFDKMWDRAPKHMLQEARTLAYAWLSKRLGIPKDETHIGRFGVDTCDRVIEIVGKKDWQYLERWIRKKRAKKARQTRRKYKQVATKDRRPMGKNHASMRAVDVGTMLDED